MTDHSKKSPLFQQRRTVIKAAGAAAGLAVAPRFAAAQSGELSVTNWGGDWNDRTVKFVEAPLVESKGIKIVRSLNLEPERKAKLLAERNLPRGTIDVAHFSGADAFELNEQGIWETLDMKKIPNYANVRPALRSPYFVPWVFGGVTIAYNRKYIKDPPTSLAELWNPKYAGKLGVLDQSFFNWIYMAALVGGGSMTNVDPAWAKLAEMKKNMKPRIYPTHQQMAAGFKAEEIWIAANYSARITQWANDGISVASSYPKEGAITIIFGAAMPKKARNKDAAYLYLNALLDPKAIGEYGSVSMYAPSTTNAILAADVRAKIDFTAEQAKSFQNVDYGYQAKNIAGWLERWNKEFKA